MKGQTSHIVFVLVLFLQNLILITLTLTNQPTFVSASENILVRHVRKVCSETDSYHVQKQMLYPNWILRVRGGLMLKDGAVIKCDADDAEPWSYQGKTNSPDAWGETYPTCYGSSQSPIAIKTAETVIDADSKPLQMKNYEIPIKKAMITNNGHTVQISPKDDTRRTIEVEGSVYTFQQLHFHWGSRYDQGSEHTLDGTRYALEAHFVHMNDVGAIAVVGVFFQSSTHDSEGFQPIIEVVPEVPFKNNFVDLKSDLILDELLPSNPSDYYHYDGSLTTPACNEGVAWFVLKGIQEIGEQQLSEMRNLYTQSKGKENAGCKMVDNFRPLQPLNGRIVMETSN